MTRGILAIAVGTLAAWGGAAHAAPLVLSTSLSPQGSWTSTNRISVTWDIQLGSPGLSSLTVEINSARDGSADGAWSPIHMVSPPEWTGAAHTISVDGYEGRRAVRLVAVDSTGRTERHLGTLLLDRSPPQAQRPSVERVSSTHVTYRWEQHDGGLASTMGGTIEVDAAQSGPGTGPWIGQLLTLADGPILTTLDGSGLSEGPHAVRLVARDAAGNTGVSPLPDLVVDRVRPTIALVELLRAPTVASPSAQIGYRAHDASSGVAIGAAARVVDVDRGVVLTHATGGPGAQTIWADLPAPGTYRLAVEIVDEAGNVGRSAPLTVSTEAVTTTGLLGAGSMVDPRDAEVRAGALRISVPGAAQRLVSGRGVQLTRSVRFGDRVRVTGRLLTATNAGISGVEIEAWDARSEPRGRTVTGPDGVFALFVRPVRGGPLRIGVPLDGELVPNRRDAELHVRLAPRVTLRASRRTARAGGAPVIFAGSVRPTPRALGIDAKNVVLEWRDPFRGSWRPMVNTRVDANGNVRAPWAFGAGGFTVPVRLRLPAEPGWPTESALSRAISIVVK